jgi:hypothetical protein
VFTEGFLLKFMPWIKSDKSIASRKYPQKAHLEISCGLILKISMDGLTIIEELDGFLVLEL